MDIRAIERRKLDAICTFKLKYPRHKQWAEDFSSWCVLQWLLGKRRVSDLLEPMAIDFMRAHVHGREGEGTIDAQTRATVFLNAYNTEIVSYRETLDQERQEIMSNIVEATPNPSIRSNDRAILFLILIYGFKQKEISFLFGVSEASVSQLLSKLKT